MRDSAQLHCYLGEQVDFLEASCARFDEGHEQEAKRIALGVRVLVHDTDNSQSVLRQLHLKTRMGWVNTAGALQGYNRSFPLNLCSPVFDGGGNDRFVPIFDEGPLGGGVPTDFETWWDGIVVEQSVDAATGGNLWTRKSFVLGLTNKEGGAHVDPAPEEWWTDLWHEEYLGALQVERDGKRVPLGNLAAATVRQIGWETLETLRRAELMPNG